MQKFCQKDFISMVTATNSVHIPKRWTKLWRQNILPLHGMRVKEFIQNYFLVYVLPPLNVNYRDILFYVDTQFRRM